MKKLIAIGATLAVAFGASAGYNVSATSTITGSNAESFEVSTGAYDPSVGSPLRWHSTDAEATFEVKEYGQDAKYAFNEGEKYSGNSAPGDKYLSIEASAPLYRTPAETTHGYNETTNMFDYAAEIVAKGVFVDTLVKFTATESLDVPDLDGGKIAVWLGTDENAPSVTNLYVTAAAVDANGVLTATNFEVTTGSAIDPAAWHRLTIRAIPNVGLNVDDAELAGFTVFVDGVQVYYTGNNYASLVSSAKVNGGSASTELSEGKLFISCVAGDTLEAVGFKGTGSIDDVTFADYANAPAFAKGAQEFTFRWTIGTVDAITIGSYELSAADLAKGSYATNLISGTIGITVDFAEGYGGKENDTVSLSAGGEYEIEAKVANFAIGDEIYENFGKAYEAAASNATTTIKLIANVTDSTETAAYVISKDIVLDLNGKNYTVTTEEDGSIFEFASGATLKLIDSVGQGVITCNGVGATVAYGSGLLTVGATTGDEGVTIVGKLGFSQSGTEIATIVKGKFDKAHNSSNNAFAYEGKIASGSSTSDGDYWSVNMGGGQQPTGWDAAVSGSTASAIWGEGVPAAYAMADAAKLADWAGDNNIAFGSLSADDLDAFLLDCAPAEVATEKAAFKLSITFNNGTPVVEVIGDKTYNVDPVIKGKASLSDSTWTYPTTSSHKFFQAFLELPAAAVVE